MQVPITSVLRLFLPLYTLESLLMLVNKMVMWWYNYLTVLNMPLYNKVNIEDEYWVLSYWKYTEGT